MNSVLQTPIEFLKGVGPQKGELLKKELEIYTYEELLRYYPFRYVDRSRFYKIKETTEELPYVQLKGFLFNPQLIGDKRKQRLVVDLQDDTGSIKLVWFQGIKWVKDTLKPNVEYVAFGKPAIFNGKINIIHPELEPVSEQNTTLAPALQPVYSSTEKLKSRFLESKGISKLQKELLINVHKQLPETLPFPLLEDLKLLSSKEALINIHFPKNSTLLQKAIFRLKFEELFFIQLRLLKAKLIRLEKNEGHPFSKIGQYFNNFYSKSLPFELTEAQKKVLKEIRLDLGSGKQMNRMLQGDVGSGKTLVALMTMLMSLDNNMQACLMAPTEILAQQHYASISSLLKDLDISVALLTGNTKTKGRKELLQKLEEGSLQILIGTHALIEETVKFHSLGMVVIDEQHRFGVEQRSKLWRKNEKLPHILVMTATPIPRTLAMTLYGDLDISIIDELPPGRKPVETLHKYDSSRLWLFEFMKKQIALGRQVYVVYPLIKESEKMDYKDLMDGFESISRAFPLPDYQVSIVHGKMKAADKEYEMQRFISGKSQIMVATTVIEVGVNIPNASVMVIESAERFGLSQLHQLRGRVGRGADQSYCILMSSHKLSADSKVRIETMVKTNDGFEIADIDLKLRGPGDLSGTRQSGVLDLRLADLAKDAQILQLARKAVINILEEDPKLILPKNENLQNYFLSQRKGNVNWSRIS